jgi:PAS domain S-box-containing protein
LLPSGKFSGFALAVVGLLTALIVFVVEGISDPSTSLLYSNLVQTAIVLWAAYCSFHVARKSSSYLRQLWVLLTATLFLGCAAQALEAYYQSFVHTPPLTPRPSDILFLLWVLPAIVMFLPRGAEDSDAIEWEQVLDFAQFGVVVLTGYLYFFYVPSRWEAEGPRMVVNVIRVQMLRDAALAAGFLIRAGTISRPSLRAFFGRMSAFFFLASIAGLAYILGPHPSPRRPDWTDILWCAPFLFAAVFAAMWNRREEPIPRAASSSFQVLVFSQVLPIFIPLVVLFMGRRIAAEQTKIAWVAITASFVLSSARLVLTNVKQRRIADELLHTEHALRRSERMFSTAFRSSPDAVGISAFPGGQFLEVNDSFTRQTGYTREEALGKTPLELNLWKDPSHRTRVMSKLREESEVKEEEVYIQTKQGETRVGQFSGTLIELDGQLCALLVVRDITAGKKAEEALRASEERFRTLVQDLHVGVVLLGPDAAILFANRAAQQMFDITIDQAQGKNSSQLDLICIREDGTELPFEMRPGPIALKTGQSILNEVLGWHRRGSREILWILGNAVPQFSQDGSISSVISSFTNISERKRAEEALHQLSTRLLQLQDEERRRLGRELHDSLAQSVLAVNLSLAQAMQPSDSLDERSRHALSEARRILQEMSREIRTLSYLLHPPLLDELGLVSAVKEYAEGFSERSGIKLDLNLQAGFGRLPQESETALFRIVQESLSNIQRHSGSQTAKIHLRADSAWVNLEVSDRGLGMEKNATAHGNGSGTRLGVGILGMRERMAQLGGKLEIESNSRGTTVRARIPLGAEVSNASTDSGSR